MQLPVVFDPSDITIEQSMLAALNVNAQDINPAAPNLIDDLVCSNLLHMLDRRCDSAGGLSNKTKSQCANATVVIVRAKYYLGTSALFIMIIFNQPLALCSERSW
jgi:hypothetical protein